MTDQTQDNYTLLIAKIDEFIRKYYKNRLIRGMIYSIAMLVILYIVIIGLELLSYFTPVIRTVLFYTYVFASCAIIWKLIVLPILKLRRIGKVISYDLAAQIIGDHFSGIRDQLINTLQLKALSDKEQENRDLILASIDQKINRLKPIPFPSAINFAQNRKYLKFALIPIIVVLTILFASPSLITGPSARLVHYQTIYERPSPFQVILLNDTLEAIQQEDFKINIKLTGNEIPDNLTIETGGAEYAMVRDNPVNFHYVLKNVQHDASFRFATPDFSSKEYLLRVLPKPIILDFEVGLTYPAYLNKKPESLSNSGDLNIPAGTTVDWKFFTRDAKLIKIRMAQEVIQLSQKGSNAFTYRKRMLESSPYSVSVSNQYIRNSDSLAFQIEVIPDFYPSITADEFRDSVYNNRFYFKGQIKDDHGFTALTFNYQVDSSLSESQNNSSTYKSIAIPIDRSLNQQTYYYFMDMMTLSANPGSGVTYFFEVWDNDGVTGSKSTKTQKMVYRIPTMKELEENTEKGNKEIKDDLADALKEAKKLQAQIDALNRQLFDKKALGWQEKEQIKNLMERQKALEQSIENIKKENAEKNQSEQQFNTPSPELLEKQKQLEKLFNEVLPDDLKKMYEELQALLDKADKEKVSDLLKQMKMNNEDIEKQLDRNLELFKQMEFEKKLGQTIDKLDNLAKKEDNLAKETEKADKKSTENIQKKQEDLNKDFKDVRDALNDLEKKNAELEEPNMLKNTDKEENSIEKEMKKSMDELSKKNSKSASQSQQKSSDEMEQLGENLAQMKDDMEGEADAEDAAAIREILENLIRISFDQENQMSELKVVNRNDPKYLQLIERQKNIQDDLASIEDSLVAISKRQVMIEPYVTKEITSINRNIDEAIVALNDHVTSVAQTKQQYVMTSVNNLALLLSESLKQMQQNISMKGSGKSKGSCSKPGQGSPSMKSMRQLQQQLNQQIENMKGEMGKPNKSGKDGKSGKNGMSEKLARMAAQQESIRKQLQGIGDEMQENGSGVSKSVKEMMQNMEQTETDLVNKIISQETVRRQQEILTRLLESEKAEQQREMEQKRESTEAKNQAYSNPANFFKYTKLNAKESELLRTIPPALKPFYKTKANAYFISFE
ncbi:MAG: DUF4175 family protein [Bacteroidales bacterium]